MSQMDAADRESVADLEAKGVGHVDLQNGQILEMYSMKDARQLLKDMKDYGVVPESETLTLHYSDGHYEVFGEGDEFPAGWALQRGLDGVAWENGWVVSHSGKGFHFVADSQYIEYDGHPIWRVEESAEHPRYRSE